ncbi:uncharacterized protein MKK02DRAFT_44338 [Dioszegia hungarica]|uniref:Uncharacterized protein n=1 Tax=Dioszegia hungarica TaxID=4972 RepID=A0AA38LVE8_9TREE|nr:uncharacterized protein MKK02DRAFT_44338 [Dioszegia hungarica]KAI9635639.1 hypothetical protein MKK02DRAFT_44338 [Dioszegia hungarica]
MPLFKSSSAASSAQAVPPARPPSPLSSANFLSRSSRPSTAAAGARRVSGSRGTPSISSGSSITGIAPSAPVQQPSAPPSTSSSSRSLSSRLLRRRPSEKTSLSRTPRLPSLSAAADESDGPSEPLTGSTMGGDVFATQQDDDDWAGGPIMPPSQRRGSHAEIMARLSSGSDGEGGSSRRGSADENPYIRRPTYGLLGPGYRPKEPSQPHSGVTALLPPPRPGAKRSNSAEKALEVEVEPRDIWGRRVSEPVQPAWDMEFPKGHPFAKSCTPRAVSVGVKTLDEREKALKQSMDGGKNRFGDAPPLPSYPSLDGVPISTAPKRALPKSPRQIAKSRAPDLAVTPPPRSSSRLTNASTRLDGSTTSLASSLSYTTSSPTIDHEVRRQPSFVATGRQWSSQKVPTARVRSNSFSSSGATSPHHDIPIPSYIPDMSAPPIAPLRYSLVSRSPRPAASAPHLQRSAVLSPSRPPRSVRRTTDSSVGSTDDASVESDEEGSVGVVADRGIYDVSVQSVPGMGPDGEIKWEVTIRPGSNAGRAMPVPLIPGVTATTTTPAGTTSVNLSLATSQTTGLLSFTVAPSPPDVHATPTRRRPATNAHTAPTSDHVQTHKEESTEPFAPHARGNTFGLAGGRKLATGLYINEAEGSPRPPSADVTNNLDRRNTVTPPPRMSTPPPMPSVPYANTTPVSSSKRSSRSTSQGEQRWALSPALSTPIAGSGTRTPPQMGRTPRELTYVSSPSPRGTPRRTRIVSASSLNGGLFAHGTVDGMSEEAEG